MRTRLKAVAVLDRPRQPPPEKTRRKHEKRRQDQGHQDVAGGRNEGRADAEQGVRYRHPAEMDDQERFDMTKTRSRP